MGCGPDGRREGLGPQQYGSYVSQHNHSVKSLPDGFQAITLPPGIKFLDSTPTRLSIPATLLTPQIGKWVGFRPGACMDRRYPRPAYLAPSPKTSKRH